MHRATGNWPAAIAAGERLEASDAAARADPDFCLRLASAYRAGSQPERALARGNALYAAANGTKLRADFERAHRFPALAERLDPSVQAEFLLGASALSVGQYVANEAPAARRCDLSRLADSSLTEAADQFLQYLGTLRPFVTNQIEVFCPPGGTR
ncbi:MAG: hypothetical protein ACYCVL_10360 [Gemmatimonadaceae bacterium]